MANHEERLYKLEKRRIELQENVAKLQASLRHWQAWEIEYESMKEEILDLGNEPEPAEIDKTAGNSDVASFGSEKALLTRKEKLLILRNDKGVTRKPDQILNIVSRRIDYVQQNIKSVTSLLIAAQKELTASEVLRDAKALNEEGLPLTEIHEELDEDGNIISSSTSIPGETAPKAVEAIEKAAGVPVTGQNGIKPEAPPASLDVAKATSTEQAPVNSSPISKPPKKKPESPKKRVSFADGMEEVSASNTAKDHKASEQKLLQEILDREADELERREMAEATIPNDESPEDAVLRRQMIQYNMDEVGAVVAEIDLEDDVISQSEYDDEVEMEDLREDEMEDDDRDEDEDEFGRTSRSKPLDGAYVKRMQALSDELKAGAIINAGPGAPTAAKKQNNNHPTAEPLKPKPKTIPIGKKGVRFAEDLDVQQAPEDIQETPEMSIANLLAASSAITGEAIIQRPDVNSTKLAEASIKRSDSGPKKVSKFKAALTEASANASIAKTLNSSPNSPRTPKPQSQILADTLVERPFTGTTSTHASSPDEPDDLDPDILKSQLSAEYHHLRSRQIQREGGFLRNNDDDEPAEVSLTETHDEDGPKKKISRFKAARLGL